MSSMYTVQHTHTHTHTHETTRLSFQEETYHTFSSYWTLALCTCQKKIHTLQQAGYLPKVPSLLHWVKGHDFNYTVIDEMRNVLNDESVIYRTSSPRCKVAITFFSRTFYTHIQKTGSIFFKYTALSSTS